MSIAQQLLGDIGHVVPAASGVPLSLKGYGAVTFVTYEDDGSTILTLTQHTNSAGSPGTESALSITNASHKVPGVGGVPVAGPAGVAGVYDLADDTTNDCMIVTVRADQLSDDNVFIEGTVDGGILMAFLHDPVHRLDPTTIPTPLTF
jgi:hypothetical protein